MTWQRRWIKVDFIVDGKFKFRCRTSASVNVNEYDELIEECIEDVEYMEDVEFLGPIRDSYDKEEVPNIEDIDESDIINGYTRIYI